MPHPALRSRPFGGPQPALEIAAIRTSLRRRDVRLLGHVALPAPNVGDEDGGRCLLAAVGSPGLAVLAALALVACGGASVQHDSQHRPSHAERPLPKRAGKHGPPARIPPARPVAMTETPRALLTVCRRDALLRPVCPRLGPTARAPETTLRPLGYCYDRAGHDLVLNGHFARLATSRCIQAGWGYEESARLPGLRRRRLSAWDGTDWLFRATRRWMRPPVAHPHRDRGVDRFRSDRCL